MMRYTTDANFNVTALVRGDDGLVVEMPEIWMDEIRKEVDVIDFQTEVRETIHELATTHLGEMEPGDTKDFQLYDIFHDAVAARDYKLSTNRVWSWVDPLFMGHLRWTTGEFRIAGTAVCWTTEKQVNLKAFNCPETSGCESRWWYECYIAWEYYDTYDFEEDRIAHKMGQPFGMYGTWDEAIADEARTCEKY